MEIRKALFIKPKWEGFTDLTSYGEDYLNYFITLKKSEGNDDVLIFMVGFVISSFLLKNLFSYLAMFFITFLRNGVLKDMRNEFI